MMKIFLIVIIMFTIVMPYTMKQSTFQTSSVVNYFLQQDSPCPKKTINNVFIQCNSNASYVNSKFFNTQINLPLQSGLISFFIYKTALCLGFKTPIYKPPK